MDEDLKKFAREFNLKSMLLSEEWFDKSLTYISGGALLLSISFIDKIVPFKDARCIWTLIVSWLVLIASLVINLLAHRRSSLNAMITINELEDEDEVGAFNKAQLRNKKMNRLTLSAVWLMGIGLLCLIFYCSINLTHMQDEKKVVQNPGDGKKGIPSFAPVPAPKPAPQNPQPAAPPPNSPKKS
jgi:hypothetical protein